MTSRHPAARITVKSDQAMPTDAITQREAEHIYTMLRHAEEARHELAGQIGRLTREVATLRAELSRASVARSPSGLFSATVPRHAEFRANLTKGTQAAVKVGNRYVPVEITGKLVGEDDEGIVMWMVRREDGDKKGLSPKTTAEIFPPSYSESQPTSGPDAVDD